MSRFFSSLTFKIGIFIILAEIAILALTGYIYTQRFYSQIKERVKVEVELIGSLIDAGALSTNVNTKNNKDFIKNLMGEEIIEALTVRRDGIVIYSLNMEPAKTIAEVKGVNPAWFNPDQAEKIFEEATDGIVSVTPIRATQGKPLFFIYMKISAKQAEAEKQRVVWLFVLGSIATVASTSVVFIVLFYWIISKRINKLLQVLRRVTSGELGARVAGRIWSDQIGVLQNDVNTMSGQLQHTIQTLEKQVAERTRGLETVVEISRNLTGILKLDDLLNQVVILTKETFAYYHVHIYLLDEKTNTLVMAAGYGEAGVEMKRQGHSIPMTALQSLVARAAREARIITVENTREDPAWLPNPLLPETHSEMAVPVISGEEVMGVLDVQSEEISGLTQQDEILLQALANQIAVAVRNARTFGQTHGELLEAKKLQRLYTGQAWERFSALRPTTNYEVRQPELPPLQEIDTPEALTAIQHKQTVDLRIGSLGDSGSPAANEQELIPGAAPHIVENFFESPEIQPEYQVENALATPLKLGDEIIGVLGIRDDNPLRRWTEEEIALLETVSEQMSLAIENARLFEETGRRAGREKIIADMTRQIWASGELEQVMRTAVEQLGVTLDASRVIIRLGTEEQFVGLPTSFNKDEENDEV